MGLPAADTCFYRRSSGLIEAVQREILGRFPWVGTVCAIARLIPSGVVANGGECAAPVWMTFRGAVRSPASKITARDLNRADDINSSRREATP